MLKQLTKQIYYMPHSNETDRPILGLICGTKYSLVVDSGASPKHAREFLEAASKLDVSPIKYLIITHSHLDHVFGIGEFQAMVIGHPNTQRQLKALQTASWDDDSLARYVEEGKYSESTISHLKKEMPSREGFRVQVLDKTYEDRLDIDLGGISCSIEAIYGDHTDDGTIIYVPQDKVLFLGDCVYGSLYNGVYGYTEEKVIPLVEDIRRYDAKHYVVSHEPVYSKSEMDTFLDTLTNTAHCSKGLIILEEASEKFLTVIGRRPTEDEQAYLGLFTSVNKARLG